MMREGSHVIHLVEPTEVDSAGFAARRRGDEVRDCLLVLEPGPKPRMGLLTRYQMNSTVVEAVVRGGTGAIDIDTCRISTGGEQLSISTSDPSHASDRSQRTWNPTSTKAIDRDQHQEGRYPAYLVLRHAQGCECVGTRKVKTGTAYQDNKVKTDRVYGGALKVEGVSGKAGYAGEDGREEVPAWHCTPSCPVKIMDEQSGVTTSAKSTTQHAAYRGDSKTGFLRGWSDPESQYDDTGGASRFFTKRPLIKPLRTT